MQPTSSLFRAAGVTPGSRSWVVDRPGGIAAGVVGLVMAGGAGSLVRGGFSPTVAMGLDTFVGASLGSQMAGSIGASRLKGGLIGAAAGLGLAAAGIFGGWPGALGAAAAAAVVRGVVLPTMLSQG